MDQVINLENQVKNGFQRGKQTLVAYNYAITPLK